MLTSLSRYRAAVAVTFALILSACASSPSPVRELTNPNGMLSYVPADTPYVLAFVEPAPDEFLDVVEPKLDRAMQGYQALIRDVFRSTLAENSAEMSIESMQRTSNIVDSLVGLMSVQAMRDAGIERESQLVFFGHGILPVLRVELADEGKFDATVARIESASGEPMATDSIDGVSYRYLGDETFKIIIGVFEGHAVFAAVPGVFSDDELRQLTGLQRPANSIVAAGTLEAIASDYGLLDTMVGLVDVERIAARFLDEPSGLDALLLADDNVDSEAPEQPLSDICKQEIRGMAGVAPRMVTGYTAIDRKGSSSVFAIELREDIANGMAGFASMVPGLGTDPGGLVSFGMSFDLQAMRAFVESRIDAVEANPFRCELFAELQANTAQMRESLSQPVPPFVYGFRGFNFILDDIQGLDLASDAPPQSVDASMLLAMDDAPTMFAMGAMLNPMLAALNLQPDGNPTELTIPQLAMIASSAHAVLTDSALAMSVGDDSEARVLEVMAASAVESPPFIAMSADASWYYNLMGESMLVDDPAEEENPMSDESRLAIADAMSAFGDLYERMYFDVRFTSRGIEMIGDVTISSD